MFCQDQICFSGKGIRWLGCLFLPVLLSEEMKVNSEIILEACEVIFSDQEVIRSDKSGREEVVEEKVQLKTGKWQI